MIKNPKLFIHLNKEDIPTDKSDSRYSVFWENEWNKVKNGIEIDGFKFSGWLYWHINHWKINTDDDTTDDAINAEISTITPKLRDNEVILNTNLIRAEEERKGLVIMGLRQFAKTTMESSYGGRAGIIFKNSQNLIMGTNADDLNNITASIDFGLLNCTEYFRVPRISRDWTSERVTLGVKNKFGDNIVHSTYVIRNTATGRKTEKGAGVSNLKCNLWDEIGKEDFLSALTATKPAMLGANGWRCIPLCTGTGGNIEKAQDAKSLFFNPETHSFLSYLQPDGRTTGLFLPGTLRQDCKYETTLANYCLSQGFLKEIPEGSELWYTDILVSDTEEAEKKIRSELDSYLKSGDIVNYNRWKAYYPLTIDDIFLSESNNAFPIDACKKQQIQLSDYEPIRAELFRNANNKVEWRTSEAYPIKKFPVSAKDHKDAPLIIYEHPQFGVPHGTYCIGIDPYNEDVSSDKINSLGTIEVYKRMYNPMGEMQNCIVATWAGRKKSVKEFHELCLMVAEFYNAIEGVLPENEDKTLIQYFFFKKKGHFLADSFELAKQINPNTKSHRLKGLSASTPNQRHYMNLMVADSKEEIYTVDEEGDEVIKIGVSKIPDIMLLEEFIQYKGKTGGSKGIHDGNFDRIISHGLALTLAKHYDVKYPSGKWKVQIEEDVHIKKPPVLKTPWGSYTKGQNNIFIKEKKSSKPINRMFI